MFNRKLTHSNAPHGAHMTWSSKMFARSVVGRTKHVMRRQFWLWPIIALGILTVVGWLVHSSIESTMRDNLASELRTLLNVEEAMLRTWLSSQENNVESLANNAEFRRVTQSLMARAGDELVEPDPEATVDGKPTDSRDLRRALARLVAPSMSAHDYYGYVLADRNGVVIAASEAPLMGADDLPEFREWMASAIEGSPTVSCPFPSVAPIADETGRTNTGTPTMFCAAPVRDDNFQVIGVLAMRIRPDREFTRILQLGRIGASGETYAFNESGTMISESRFENALILLGLVPDREGATSLLQLQVRDPGGDMTSGYRPEVRRSELPLTRMAERAIDGDAAVDVDGYPDYRGVPVVGAWTWLPEYHFGVTTEADVAEAYRPLTILKIAFWSLMSLLGVCSIGLLMFAVVASRLQREAREAAIEAKQLGQYKLDEKIGEGAMGVVYQGHHAMLRRPTAIKLLNAENVTDESIARFEHEVQTTSRLNHPNTIAIYDFGRTPEDVFYYAMEFLDGIDLQDLVGKHGPQSAARTIYVLQQVCRSLAEAHAHGLVHRDIKPANIMLNQRGGESDFVKVLDFGLVKAQGDRASASSGMAGTPLYMSPESIQMPDSVDARSDIYAVGAVGYFMLTGQPVFDADTFSELCQKQISEQPQEPSKIVKEIPEDLENVILRCLEKDRSRRPQSARELARQLNSCAAASEWDTDRAEHWWNRYLRNTLDSPETVSDRFAATMDSGFEP